jgi:predicted AlkP superfamily phosphohydrolase/phosphomutase
MTRTHAAALFAAFAVGLVAAGCAGREHPPRVLVIGLDGATLDRMDPLMAEGLLPHLAALRARGAGGVLESTLPSVSPPAWATAITGVNPGKHNIYDFYRMAVSSTEGILNTSRDRRAHPVWRFLNGAGYRTGIMNIPMTFPPDSVDGFFISGFPYGANTTGYTWPAELEEELQPYPLDPFGEGIVAGSEQPFLDQLVHTFDRHSAEAKRLLVEEDWDLFWVVFTGIDKSQHFFWKFSDPEHPDYDAGLAEHFGPAIRDFYIRADRAVGEMLEIVGPETNVIVMSDHGMGPVYRELRMWNWLRQRGFFRPDTSGGGRHWLEAYPPGPFADALRVSIAGRDPNGQIPRGEASEVRERLVADLSALVDPVTGAKFVEKVWVREQLYDGPWVENAPDVVFLETRGGFAGRGTIEVGEAEHPLFGPASYSFSGYHRPEGFLIAAGPDFATDPERRTYSLLDIAPTIYWLFRLPMPSDLDGTVPAELVGGEALAARPVRKSEERAVMGAEEAAEIPEGSREVLETLGYVQ